MGWVVGRGVKLSIKGVLGGLSTIKNAMIEKCRTV